MLSIVQKYLHDFKKTDNGFYVGFIDSTDRYKQFLTDLNAAGFCFSTRKSEIFQEIGHLLFRCNKSDVPVPFCGSPFRRVKNIYYECVNGSLYFGKSKKIISLKTDEPNITDRINSKNCPRLYTTKKIGCKARMVTKCIKIYNEYTIDAVDAHWRHKREVIRQIKSDLLTNGVEVKSILRYFIKISVASHHCHGVTSPGLGRGLHLKLTREIRRLAKCNITSPDVIKCRLKEVVDNLCENKRKPDLTDDGFYLSDSVIKNHVYAALYDMNQKTIDQEGLENLIQKWRSAATDDLFYFRPYKSADGDSEAQPLLFCHQSFWQRKLLQHYGNRLSLLDPMYKSIEYSLPVFFLVVKTNISYAIVGTFVILAELPYLVEEALQVFKAWSPCWKPNFFLTGGSGDEVSAVKNSFSCAVHVCPLHREFDWHKEIRRKSIITPEFSKDMLPRNSQSITAIHTDEDLLTLRFNNGIESLSSFLGYSFIKYSFRNSLGELLTVIIEDTLVETYLKYIRSNGKVNNHCQLNDIPDFLGGRPESFVEHMLSRMEIAKEEYGIKDVADCSNGVFGVQSRNNYMIWHIVDFKIPSCGCGDFTKWGYPCKHFCAIFINVPEWSFNQLPQWYRENPFLNIDLQFGTFCEENISSESGICLSSGPETELEMLVLEPHESTFEPHSHHDVIVKKSFIIETSSSSDSYSPHCERSNEMLSLTLTCQNDCQLRELLIDLTKVND